MSLEHGERFGKLTVLRRCEPNGRGAKYICGCTCGFSPVFVKQSSLKNGRVTACLKCSSKPSE